MNNLFHLTNIKYFIGKVTLVWLIIVPLLSVSSVVASETADFPSLEAAFESALAAYIRQVNPKHAFKISETKVEGVWAYAVAMTESNELEVEEDYLHSHEFIVLLARRDGDQSWLAIAPEIVSAQEYNDWLADFPDTLIDESTRAYLHRSESIQQTQQLLNFSEHKLPWPSQQTAYVTRKDGTDHENQIDFDILGGGSSGDVYASKPGTVVFVKESSNSGCNSLSCWQQANMVVVQHTNNQYSWYVHLAHNSVPVAVGDTIGFGTKVGVEGATGYVTGVHLHYMGSTGHTTWTDPNNANTAPWGTGITAVDFVEASWASLTAGQQYTSQNSSSCCGCLLAQPLADSQPLSEYEAWLAVQVEGEGRVERDSPLGLDGLLLEGADEDVVMEDEDEEEEVVHEVADGDVVIVDVVDEEEVVMVDVVADADVMMEDEVAAMEEVVDEVAPTGSLMVDGGGEVVRSLNVTLNLAAEDAEGAVTGMRFSTDGQKWSAWEPYRARRLWQLENHGAQQLLYAQVRDEAGNVSEPLMTAVVAELNVEPPSSDSYTLARRALTMGGGQKTSTSYIVRGNSGQSHQTGELANSSYRVISGFWAGIDASASPNPDQIMLRLSPITVTTSISNTFEVDMIAQAGTAEVDGVSAYLNFNPAELRVLGMTLVTDFQIVLQNHFDNNTGEVDFAAGMLSEPYPSGTFTLATITFEAIGESDGSAIDFNMTPPRQSDMTFGGSSILEGTAGSTVMISNLATLKGCVTLQGRPSPPHSRSVVPLRVSLTVPGESVPAYTFEPTTDENGCFEVTGIALGTYQVRVKKSTTLQNLLEPPVTLTAGMNEVYLYTLLEGDANDDNIVNIRDFSILATAFGTQPGDEKWDVRADFNGDNNVNIQDFSLLASNFTKMGDIIVPPTAMMEESRQPSEGVTMLIEPASTSVKPDELFSVRVKLETGNQKVDGTQILLHFDPQLLQVEQLLAGETFPVELINEVDNRNGTISFAAGTLEAFPSGTLDVIELQLRALAPTEGTSLTFAVDNPQSREANDTLSADVTFEGESVLGNYADGVVIVSQPTSVMLQELAAPATGIAWWLIVPLGLIVLGGIWIMRRKQEG